jgi:hypothetical protein
MVCLFHGDYGPPDPAFAVSTVSAVHGWAVDASLLKDARNIGVAEAVQRHVLKGDLVSWCHQGYSWVDQDAIGWFYLAAFGFVVLPYLVIKTLVFVLASILVPRLLGHIDLHDLGLLTVLVTAAFVARILVLFALMPPLETRAARIAPPATVQTLLRYADTLLDGARPRAALAIKEPPMLFCRFRWHSE